MKDAIIFIVKMFILFLLNTLLIVDCIVHFLIGFLEGTYEEITKGLE